MLVAQLCLTFCNRVYRSPTGSSVHGIFQARTLEWVTFSSPGDVPTQRLNPGHLHCREILYHLSHLNLPAFSYHHKFPLILNTSPTIEQRLHLIYQLVLTCLFISCILWLQMHFIVQRGFVYMPLNIYGFINILICSFVDMSNDQCYESNWAKVLLFGLIKTQGNLLNLVNKIGKIFP